jgi:hypothetical protein
MNKATVGAAIATALLAGAAYAQAPASPPALSAQPTAPTAGSTTSTTFTLAAADETKLKDWITAQKTVSVPAPAGFNVVVGTAVPTTITLHPIPATAGVTAVGSSQYAVVGDKVILVNPADRKIVYVFAGTAVAQAGQNQSGQIVVQQPAPSIRVDQAPPQVTVQPGQPNVTVRQPQPEIVVRQPAPAITVDIPQPEIIVRLPKPEVNVTQTQPQVSVNQPPPRVEVIQPQQQAQVQVQPIQPQVSVAQGAAAPVQIEQTGQPTVRYERAEPKVTITEQKGQPTIRFEQADQVAALDQNQAARTNPTAAQPAAGQQQTASSATLPATAGRQFQNRQVVGTELRGIDLVNVRNDKLGDVDRIVLNTADNQTYAIVGYGGFLGIGEKKVLIPLQNVWMDGKKLVTDLSDDQLKRMPEWKADAVAYRDIPAGQTMQIRVPQ